MKPLSDSELEEMYKDFLDELYGTIQICGYEYAASHALKEVDPTAFRCGLADWTSGECEAGNLFEHEGEYYLEDPSNV